MRARHGMRPADDAVTHAMVARVGGEIEGAVKLVRLDADERDQRNGLGIVMQQAEVTQVLPHVLVDRADLDRGVADACRRHAGDVVERGIGHEPPFETLHRTVGAVLARLDQYHSKLFQGTSVPTVPVRRTRRHVNGAGRETRTLMVSPPADFESAASTGSAIPAEGLPPQ